MRTQWIDSCLQSREGALRCRPYWPLNLGFQFLELGENEFWLLKPKLSYGICMAVRLPHCSTLAWMEEPGRLQSMGSLKSRTRLSDFTFTLHFHALEKEMATHSSVLALRIPGTGKPGWAAVYGVAQSRTWLMRRSSSNRLPWWLRLKRLPPVWETQVQSLGREDPLEKEMLTHSSVLAWRIPWTEDPGRLQSTGSQRVRHDWATSLHFTFHFIAVRAH